MNEKQILSEIEADRQLGRFVLYLEGKTDPDMFFALLGVAPPVSGIHQDVYVRGLKIDKGSGRTAVRIRVDVAVKYNLALVPGEEGVGGILDGDGRDLDELAAEFDPPHGGPLFSWKSYCLENLLARAIWPAAWGAAPTWQSVLEEYSPYSALNRVHVQLRAALETLRLAKFTNPQLGQPLLSSQDVKTALGKDKGLIANRDVEKMFDAELETVRSAIAASLDRGHALCNGRWIVDHRAPSATGKSADQCRAEWCHAVCSAGGMQEVRDLWQRITGTEP